MTKKYLMANIVLIALILAGDVLYTLLGGLWLKGLTSLFFVLLGGVNLLYISTEKIDNKKFGVFLLVGLFVCFVADIVLNLNFMLGAIVFALGHVFYIIAYSADNNFKWGDLVPSVIIFVPVTLMICLLPIFDFGGNVMKIVCIIYALIISVMVGKCISNYIRERSVRKLLLLIGSLLFMFSDLMLLFDNFSQAPMIMGVLCLATYYPGQALIGSCMYWGNLK